jgi:hypothetical protein
MKIKNNNDNNNILKHKKEDNEIQQLLAESYEDKFLIAYKIFALANKIGVPKSEEEKTLLNNLLIEYNQVMSDITARMERLKHNSKIEINVNVKE